MICLLNHRVPCTCEEEPDFYICSAYKVYPKEIYFEMISHHPAWRRAFLLPRCHCFAQVEYRQKPSLISYFKSQGLVDVDGVSDGYIWGAGRPVIPVETFEVIYVFPSHRHSFEVTTQKEAARILRWVNHRQHNTKTWRKVMSEILKKEVNKDFPFASIENNLFLNGML